MNNTYRSVWSESDQTWVAAPETAAARGKSVRRLAVLATSAVGIAASVATVPASATSTTTTITPGTVGQGGLELCSGATGYSWGNSGGSQAVDCSVDGKGTTDGLAFSLNNSADSNGGYGFNSSTAQIAGYQDGTLNIKGARVMVYGPTTFDSVVTMSDQKIVQLAPGLVSATSTEAVNGSQLYATNSNVSNLQDQMANAVMYDTPAHDTLTLGGAGASTPVALHNVAAGDLSATSTDAVNGSQLYATNANVSDLQGQVANSVQYDTPAHDAVTLGGTGATVPVALHNVAAGDLSATSTDAVNGSQLFATNSNVSNLQGQVADAVMYDSSSHDAVTFGGAGASTPIALHNVAAGDLSATSTDAVNGSQLYVTNSNVSDLQGQVANSVQYDTPSHDAVTFGGAGASTPVALHNVAAGDLSATSTDAVNGSQLYVTNSNVSDLQGQVANSVQYDTPSHDAVTFGGAGASTPVALHNVAAGDLSATSTDAVNGSQLYATNQSITNLQGQVGDAVQYDSSSHDAVTLGGAGATAPVALHNVAAGDLSATSTDAVNGSQLYATNSNVSDLQGQVANSVQYDTPTHDAVTFGGAGATTPVALHNVAAGDLSATSTDAVNGSQLYTTNSNVSDLQGQMANAVMYDTPAHDTLTLGGTDPTTPVALHNVAAGDLSPTSTDAVNGSQLYTTNSNVSNLQGQVADAVMYDSSSHDAVTFGGAGAAPVALHNVAEGDLSSTSTDAVNGSQLYATNSNVSDLQGQVANSVQYDTPSHDAVTFGGAGATPVALHNVAAGDLSTTSTDAVNGSQLYATNQSITNLQGQIGDAVQYDTPTHDAVTLGGTAYTAPVALHNVAEGDLSSTSTDAINGSQLYATNQAVQGNETSITNLTQNIINGTIGIVQQDPSSRTITVGKSTNGTLVDLTGTDGSRRLTGLAAGLGTGDAVNVAQMQSAGFQFDGAGNVTNTAVTYNAGTFDSGNPTITLATGTGNSLYFRNHSRADGLLPAGTVISNVANGIQDTDAVNLGQVGDLIAKASAGGALGASTIMAARRLAASDTGSGVVSSTLTTSYETAAYYSQVSGLGDSTGLVGPSDMARAAGAGSIAIGSNAYTPGVNGVAVGVQAYASANDSVALGSGSVANKDNTVSVGSDGTGEYAAMDSAGGTYYIKNQANTRRIVNMAAGQDDTDAVNVSQLKGVLSAIGGGAAVSGDGTILAPAFSVGGTTVNSVSAAIANLDTRVTRNTADIAALGGGGSGGTLPGTPPAGTTTTPSSDADAVHYDASSHDTVTLSNTSGDAVKMTGLQNAALTESSTDAVTGQQLYATNQQLATLGQSVQNISTTGSTALSVTTKSGPAAATGAQSVAAGGGAVATGDHATALGDMASASGVNSVAIGANSVADRKDAVSVGQAGAERQIVNVATGTLGTDAVNVDQMNNTIAQQSNAFNQQLSGLQRSIDTVSKNAYAGVAAAMAMPNLTPSGPGRTVVAAGGGYYKGSSAAAVGVTYRSANMHWLVNGAVSVTDNGDAGARAQVGYEF